MKKKGKFTNRFFLQMLGACLLIMIGMFFIGKAFTEYGQIFLKNQDEQLYHLAQAVDRNIENLLERYGKDLEYVIGRRGFLEAQQTWVDTGDTEDLLFRMEENIVAQDGMIKAILAMKDEEVFLSTDGQTDYHMMRYAGTEQFRASIDGAGNIYLGFLCEAGNGLSYAALMNLDVFYQQIVGENLAAYDWVILTDASREILLYRQKGKLLVEEVDAVTSATCGQDGVDILL